MVAFVDVADEAHRDADRADVGDHPLRPGAWDIKTFSVGDATQPPIAGTHSHELVLS